jgi:heme-degrading monooxygenase HmoA
MYARMMIVEAIDDEGLLQVGRDLSDTTHDLSAEPGYERSEILTEDDGRMLVSLTIWQSREDALRFHSSRLNRRLVAKVDSHVIGGPVVKLFKVHDGGVR